MLCHLTHHHEFACGTGKGAGKAVRSRDVWWPCSLCCNEASFNNLPMLLSIYIIASDWLRLREWAVARVCWIRLESQLMAPCRCGRPGAPYPCHCFQKKNAASSPLHAIHALRSVFMRQARPTRAPTTPPRFAATAMMTHIASESRRRTRKADRNGRFMQECHESFEGAFISFHLVNARRPRKPSELRPHNADACRQISLLNSDENWQDECGNRPMSLAFVGGSDGGFF